MNIPKIEEIYLQGRNSQKELVVEVEVVAALVDAYLTKVPNESRTTKMALRAMRFHDAMKGVLVAETEAVAKEVEKRTSSVFKTESGDSCDMPF